MGDEYSQGDIIRKRSNTFLQAHPFPIDVERLQVVAQWVRRNSYDVQAVFQCRWGDALLSREATHVGALQHVEAIRTIGKFPRDGIEIALGGDEQDASWCSLKHQSKGALSKGIRREQRIVEFLTIKYRIINK